MNATITVNQGKSITVSLLRGMSKHFSETNKNTNMQIMLMNINAVLVKK